MGLVVSSLTPSLFCLSAASLDRWPQSVLLFHLDPKPSEPPPGRLLRILESPSARSSKNQELLKGDSMEGHMKALMTRKFFFLHVGGSSAGAALELPHCHLAPGAATKPGVESIPKLSFRLLGSCLKPPSHSNVKSKRCIYPLWSLADPVLLSWFMPQLVTGLSLSRPP